MRIQVKMFISLDIDPDEYMMPSDGDVTEEFQDAMREYIHDIDVGYEMIDGKFTVVGVEVGGTPE